MTSGAAAPQWRPDPTGLQHVVGMLRESTEGSNVSQENLYKQLEAYAAHSDFNNYLAYILAHGEASAASEAGRRDTAHGANHSDHDGDSKHGYLDRGSGPLTTGVESNSYVIAGNGTITGTNGAAMPVLSENVRQAAGLLLKNNLKVLYKNLPPDIQAYINKELLSAIGDASKLVRSVVAVCITAIVSKAGLHVYPDLFPTLVSCLDSSHDTLIDGALNALCRICEDAPDLLEEDPSQPLGIIIPKLLNFFLHPKEPVRIKVIHIVNQFLLVLPPALNDNMDLYLSALFRVAEDKSFEVRKHVCSALCMLLETKPEVLEPHMLNIIEYMVQATSDSSPAVALEACEFWCAYAETSVKPETRGNFLPSLVPKLLNNMIFAEADIAALDAEVEEDDMIADRAEDFKPRFHQPRFMGAATDGVNSSMTSRVASTHASSSSTSPDLSSLSATRSDMLKPDTLSSSSPVTTPPGLVASGLPTRNDVHISLGEGLDGQSGKFIGNLLDYDRSHAIAGSTSLSNSLSNPHTKLNSAMTTGEKAEEPSLESDDDDTDVDYAEEWTVRRCSAAALDSLACKYGDEILSILLPVLQERLVGSERWERREAGILALGAVAEGCYSGIVPHMHRLFPYLTNALVDSHHCVRIMSCWTLSRYSRWIIEERDDVKTRQLLQALSDRMLDRNKTVQKAACSALATYEEHAGSLLVPYVGPILQCVASAFDRYQQNNIVVLLDTVCTLADAVGSELASQENVNLLMPHLIKRWNALSDSDPALVPLFECLGYVFRSLGEMSQQFVSVIFTRCINLVETTYASEIRGKNESIHCDFLTCSLDLMCSLTEALGPGIDPFLVQPGNTGNANLLQLLFAAMKDRRQEVRQSAFALVGELARARAPSLIPVLKDYIQAVVDALNPDYMSVANNATWALGEIIMLAGFLPSNVPLDRDAIKRPLVEQALGSLIRVVNIRQLNKSLLENTAITIGRLGLVMPDAMAPHLETFAESVFASIRNIRDDHEKEQACFGINAMIRLNPNAILHCFVYYADSIASWLHVEPKLEADFATVLNGYKNSLGDQWDGLYATFPPHLQTCLHGRFNL